MVTWRHDDGGRAVAGYRGEAGDCVARAIAIATDTPYREAYALVADAVHAATGKRSARNGVPTKVIRALLADLGFKWTPTMEVGSGTRVHLRADELPAGTLIVRLSGHVTVVSDGTVLDTHDPSRGGTRAVYGYWRQ